VTTGLGIQAAPATVDLPVERPEALQPLTALAVTCATNPLFTGRLTASSGSTTAVSRITSNTVYGYISDVDQAWSCTASVRYSAIAWNTAADEGRFNWGNLINSTSVACNWLVGSTDYLKANSTSDCPDSDAEYAMAVSLTPQGVYHADVNHNGFGDFSFAHSDCDTYHGAEPIKSGVSFSSGSTSNRPDSSNCDPITLDGTGTSQTITYDSTAPTGASTLTGGIHAITATATDASNNTSAPSAPLSVTIDLDDPSLLMGVNEGAIKSSSRTVEIEFQADDPTSDVVAVEASNDNSAFTAVSGPTPSWTLTPGDGVKTVWVRVTDSAGRTTTWSDTIILDSTLPAVTLDTTSISVTMERGTSRQEGVTITPSLVLYGATLDLSPSLSAVIDPPVPAGTFKAMDEVELDVAVGVDVPQSAALGPHTGTLTLRASDGTALGTIGISVTVTDPPPGTVPATVSAPSSDRQVVDADGDTVVIDTVVVGLESNTVDPTERILAIASAHGGIVRGQVPGARIYQVQVPGTDDVAELEALRQALGI
jgi:hypothetical protein